MVIADRQTGTIWSHLSGTAFQGPLEGRKMELIPLLHTTWEEWLRLHPESTVLSYDTEFQDRYRSVSIGRANGRFADQLLTIDDRLPSNELVLGVMAGGEFAAYPIDQLEEVGGVLNDEIADLPIVVFYDVSAGAAIAYSSVVDGEVAEFELADSGEFAASDSVTGGIWDFAGRQLGGDGTLEFVASYLSEWYGWSAYHPSTAIRPNEQS